MTRARLFLDVDGVLNAICSKEDIPDFWSEWKSERSGNNFLITWAPELMVRLTELSERVDILWLTTWEDWANDYISPLVGLPQFDLAGRRDHAREVMEHNWWWKLGIVQDRWLKDQTPFIWLDDDLKYTSDARAWLGTLPEDSYIAISPHTKRGLKPTQLDLVDAFLDKLEDS